MLVDFSAFVGGLASTTMASSVTGRAAAITYLENRSQGKSPLMATFNMAEH